MPNHAPEMIEKYEVLFGARTGVTILIPKTATFDCGVEIPVSFRISPDSPRDILISAAGKTALLKGLKKDYLDEVIERGFIMFYETQDEEVVRCTPCRLQGK